MTNPATESPHAPDSDADSDADPAAREVEALERLAVPTRASVLSKLELGLFRWPYVQVLLDATPVPASRYTRSRTVLDTQIPGFVVPERITEMMDDGATVVVHSVEHWCEPFDTSLRGHLATASRPVTTLMAIGGPLSLPLLPPAGATRSLAVPAPDSAGVSWVGGPADRERGDLDPDLATPLPLESLETLRLTSPGQAAVAVVHVRRPVLQDVTGVVAQHARRDEACSVRYHQWGHEQTRREAARALLEAVRAGSAPELLDDVLRTMTRA